MPYYDEIVLKHPIAMQAIGNWTFCGTIDQGLNTQSIAGSNFDNRGTYQVSFGGLYYHLYIRNGAIVASQFGLDASFPGGIFPAKTSGGAMTFVQNIKTSDGNLWVLGRNVSGAGIVLALPAGFFLNASADPNWIERTGDLPSTSVGSPNFFRKAESAGNFYFLFSDVIGNTTTVMRAAIATATTTGFTSISTSKIPSSNVVGYGVSPDGITHLAATSTGTCYRSTDGGVTWASITLTINTNADFTFSTKFGRWMANGGGIGPAGANAGMHYSDNNGLSWTTCKGLGEPSVDLQAALFYQFTHVERIVSDGSILLGIAGQYPIQLWISLNGGREWAFLRALNAPFNDPANNQTVPLGVINDGSRILIYQSGLTGDEGLWCSDMFGTPIYRGSGSKDPHYWKP